MISLMKYVGTLWFMWGMELSAKHFCSLLVYFLLLLQCRS